MGRVLRQTNRGQHYRTFVLHNKPGNPLGNGLKSVFREKACHIVGGRQGVPAELLRRNFGRADETVFVDIQARELGRRAWEFLT